MDLIGEILKSERIKKNLNLVKISQDLNISQAILEKIEDNEFPKYINTVFLIGHIKSYAKVLELDQTIIVEQFKIQTSYQNLNLTKEISKPIQAKSFISIPKTLSFASVVFLFSGFYFLFIQSNNIESNYAMTPNVPENLIYELEEIEMNLALMNKKDKILEKIIQSNDNNIVLEELNKLSGHVSVVASAPKEEDVDILKQNITLQFINPTWIQIKNQDDKIIMSKLMDKGDEYTYNTSKKLYLTAGNAGNIIVSLDGIVKGKAGKFGEVVESLIIDSNFNN